MVVAEVEDTWLFLAEVSSIKFHIGQVSDNSP